MSEVCFRRKLRDRGCRMSTVWLNVLVSMRLGGIFSTPAISKCCSLNNMKSRFPHMGETKTSRF